MRSSINTEVQRWRPAETGNGVAAKLPHQCRRLGRTYPMLLLLLLLLLWMLLSSMVAAVVL